MLASPIGSPWSFDEAGRNGIHSDLGPDLIRQVPGQVIQCRLGNRIRNAATQLPLPSQRGDVHHRTAAPLEVRQGQEGQLERTEQVDVEDLLPDVGGERREVLVGGEKESRCR